MADHSQRDPRQLVGERGEKAVRDHIETLGWRIVDHNVRWREGELDVIALDGDTLVIGEVKTLVGRGADGRPSFSPFESIGPRKQEQIRMLARRWLGDELRRSPVIVGRRFNALRFDAFAVVINRNGDGIRIEHLPDAF